MDSKELEVWLNLLKLSSVPLIRLDANGVPDSVASGCIVNFKGRKFILSVSHATGDGDGWAAEIRYEDNRQETQIYRFGHTFFLSEIDLTGNSSSEVDFSYSEIYGDFESWFQYIDSAGVVHSEEKRVEFEFGRHEPDKEEQYGFAGRVRSTYAGPNALASEMAVYPGLRFDRTEGGVHIFKLPVTHPGHEAFQGCSGAPLIDTKGRVVGLICSGNENDDTIRAVSLSKYGVALEVHVLQL